MQIELASQGVYYETKGIDEEGIGSSKMEWVHMGNIGPGDALNSNESLLCQWKMPLPGGTSMGPLHGKVRHFRLYANETIGKKVWGRDVELIHWLEWLIFIAKGNQVAAITKAMRTMSATQRIIWGVP